MILVTEVVIFSKYCMTLFYNSISLYLAFLIFSCSAFQKLEFGPPTSRDVKSTMLVTCRSNDGKSSSAIRNLRRAKSILQQMVSLDWTRKVHVGSAHGSAGWKLLATSTELAAYGLNVWGRGKGNRKFVLMLTRRAKAYSSSGSAV